MYHIGINAFHANSSVALFKKNKLIFAIEEERLNRIKNWFGFPFLSLQYILENYNIDLNKDISSINFNFDSNQNFAFKIQTLLSNPSVLKKRFNIFEKSKKQKCINYLNFFGLKDFNKIKFHDHHTTHINYSFYTSKFDKAFIVSLDGFGDQKSGLIGFQNKSNFEKIAESFYPHSLGIFYQAFTQLLGFKNYGDEYKVMGMSAYGSKYISEIDEVVNFDKNNLYKLNLDFFNHHKVNIEELNENSQIEYKNLYSSKLYETFKKYRSYDIAYTIQKKFENIVFKIINEFNPKNNSNLCFTGGCALNSLLNGKIYINCPSIKKININATPNDSGGSIGAVLTHLNKKSRVLTRSRVGLYTGISYSKSQIKKYFDHNHDFKIIDLNNNQLIEHATKDLINGKVIGWFQGKMEWGPRSLGNRSILANPSYKNIKDLINKKIKRRESFRPFAPSIIIDQAKKWFHYFEKEPHMIKVYKFKKEKIKNIPSVVHKDLTGRLQTVERKDNKIYYDLIKSFYLKTDIPLILNTSFNENEPVVNTPGQALNCFNRNDFDTLYLGNFKITKLKNSKNNSLKFNKNISIIILCLNEELHIERLIKNIKKFTSKIFVVDSFSSDKTIDILTKYKINYIQRNFISYSDQLNWAIKNNPFKTDWIFRMDSDELLNKKLVKEIDEMMNTNIHGIMVKRNVFFLNRQLSNGVHKNSYILRVWRRNLGYCSEDLVDEQIILKEGIVSKTKSLMIEKNLKGFFFYLAKHLKYSSLEANNYFLNKKRFRLNSFRLNKNNNKKYEIYYKLPIFIRPILYFFYLLFFKSPFKDGLVGLLYLVIQTLIYRFIVDLKILTISINKFFQNAHK